MKKGGPRPLPGMIGGIHSGPEPFDPYRDMESIIVYGLEDLYDAWKALRAGNAITIKLPDWVIKVLAWYFPEHSDLEEQDLEQAERAKEDLDSATDETLNEFFPAVAGVLATLGISASQAGIAAAVVGVIIFAIKMGRTVRINSPMGSIEIGAAALVGKLQ